MKMSAIKFWSYACAFGALVFLMTNCQKDTASKDPNGTEVLKKAPPVSNLSRKCLAHEKMHTLLIANPELQESRQRLEAFTNEFARSFDNKLGTRSVVTIPVVFHIVYNTAAQNVSDAQIQSQMRVLNEDFRKLNANANSIPSVFRPLAADTEINFVLAKQDPSGAATTGIVRKQTSTTKFIDEKVMSAATGGSNIWDSKRYLNIYVCNLPDYLGFAYYPGVPANIDAAVINFKAFGTMGTAVAPYNLGKTAVHEVGHWLNLDHIWGDDEDSNDVCGGTDHVADTPNQGEDNSGTPSFPTISCGNTPHGDMFMNYMDYSDDVALNMFTLGQKARMQALFAVGGARRGIATSNGGTAPTGGGTGGGSTTCTDNYESNNTEATAKTIPLNTTISANIGTKTDKDWFKITTTAAQPKLKIDLTNVPADYDVYVYRNGSVVAYSQNDGTAAEQVIYNATSAGTYNILVEAYYVEFNASKCYNLKATTGSANFRTVASPKLNNAGKKDKKMLGLEAL
jgi:Pregnancy-associated plasma protein-A/Bacterial pre-peptidase C-terminal domain